MAKNRRLSPTEIGTLFEGKDRTRNSRYVHTLMSNPDTPEENVNLIGQYVIAHPEQFLTDEEISKNPGILGKRQRYRRNDRLYSDGYSYDDRGQNYDPSGNMVDGMSFDDDRGYRDPYRTSDYRMSRKEFNGLRKDVGLPPMRNDPSKALSPSKVNALMMGLKSDYARTRYFQKVRDNPESNTETVDNLILWKDQHPHMFVDEGTADRMAIERQRSRNGGYGNGDRRNYRGNRRNDYRDRQNGYPSRRNDYRDRQNGYGGNGRSCPDFDRESWNSSWISRDEFDSMPQNKRSLFSRFFGSKDRNRNSKLALKILVDPRSSQEDVTAVRDIVNESPKLFFKNGGKGRPQQRC